MSINLRRKNRIHETVQKLIDDHDTNDPMTILTELGVNLMPFIEKTSLLGMYKNIQRNEFVFYNAHVQESYLRLTFAHELGHIILHKNYSKEFRLFQQNILLSLSKKEYEANLFAAHLLIDDEEIITLFKEGYSIFEIAGELNEHPALVVIKLKDLERSGCDINVCNLPEMNLFQDIDGRDPKIQNYDF